MTPFDFVLRTRVVFGEGTLDQLGMLGVELGFARALIADAQTHAKMACGDEKAAFRIAILDPVLTVSQPAAVTAIAGYDAISHAVESYVTARRTSVSDLFAREAWRLLEGGYERVLEAPRDVAVRG